MASKVTKRDQQDQQNDMHLFEAVRKSADEIWQAGLGAFVRAQKEGQDAFIRLVQEGLTVQKKVQQLAGGGLPGMADTISKMGFAVGKQASGSLEKLETVFEDRVARSLKSIGVSTQEDIRELNDRITELQQSLDAIAKKPDAKAAGKTAAPAAGKRAPAKAAKNSAATKTRSKRNSGTISTGA